MPDLSVQFAALADPVRLEVVRVLAAGPRRSSELADALATPRPAMSRHLRVLAEAGLVDERPVPGDHRGRSYALRAEGFAGARGFLAELEGFWSDQLAAFKAHAERA